MENEVFLSRLSKIEQVNNKIFSTILSSDAKGSQNNIIFIYTPPKVGSTCLVTSIRLSAARKFCVLHIHDEVMLNFIMDNNDTGVTVSEIIRYNQYLGKNVYVIDVFRTPVERKMSEFFEKISVYHFNNSEENINNYNIERVIKRFNNLFPHLSLGDHYADKFDINVVPFQEGQLFDSQVVNGINYIKLRLKDSSEWGNILTSLLKTDIVIVRDYETKNKSIGKLYKAFNEAYKIPTNYFQLIQDDKYLSLYYSEEERMEYLGKWRDKMTVSTFIGYSESEYKFYVNLNMENQFYNDLQFEHYIDCGCLCVFCSVKRGEILSKVRRGQISNEKIIHKDIIKKKLTNSIRLPVPPPSRHDDIKRNTMSNLLNKNVPLSLTNNYDYRVRDDPNRSLKPYI